MQCHVVCLHLHNGCGWLCRLLFEDEAHAVHLYNAVNDEVLLLMDATTGLKAALWDATDPNLFIISDGKTLYTYLYMPTSLQGPSGSLTYVLLSSYCQLSSYCLATNDKVCAVGMLPYQQQPSYLCCAPAACWAVCIGKSTLCLSQNLSWKHLRPKSCRCP